MKRSEIIKKYYDVIREVMVEHYGYVIEADGKCQYQIYIWEDGELEYLHGPQGDHSWLKPHDMEPRKLFYICTICESPSFNIWDFADEGMPEDEVEKDAKRKEIIEWLIDGYKDIVCDLLDNIIDEAEQDERYE